MTIQDIHQRLVDRFDSETIVALETGAGDPWIEVRADAIADVAEYLKHDPALQFDQLCNLSGVDYCEPDPKQQAKFGHEPHIEVVYHLYSFSQNSARSPVPAAGSTARLRAVAISALYSGQWREKTR